MNAKERRHFAYVGAAMRWGDKLTELDTAESNKAHDVAMVAMKDIQEKDRDWRDFFRSLLNHEHDAVVLLAAAVLRDEDRQAAVDATRRVAQRGNRMLATSAKQALRCQFKVEV